MTESTVFRAVEEAVQEEIRWKWGFREELDSATGLIRIGYSQKSLDNGSATHIPFSQESFRWAYAYRYFTSHTYIVLKAFNRFWDNAPEAFNAWINTMLDHKLHVCCVGGGPGTDLIGIALFIQHHNLDINNIQGSVLDRWTDWKGTFRALSSRLELPTLGRVNYCYFDFNQPNTWGHLQRIQNADLVTMVKFVSAVAANPREFQDQLTAILKQMKDGAMLFVLDNGCSQLFQLVCQAAAEAGLHVLGQVDYKKGLQLPQGEKKAIDASNLLLGGLKPQKSTVVSAFLWQKEASQLLTCATYDPPHQTYQFLQRSERCSPNFSTPQDIFSASNLLPTYTHIPDSRTVDDILNVGFASKSECVPDCSNATQETKDLNDTVLSFFQRFADNSVRCLDNTSTASPANINNCKEKKRSYEHAFDMDFDHQLTLPATNLKRICVQTQKELTLPSIRCARRSNRSAKNTKYSTKWFGKFALPQRKTQVHKLVITSGVKDNILPITQLILPAATPQSALLENQENGSYSPGRNSVNVQLYNFRQPSVLSHSYKKIKRKVKLKRESVGCRFGHLILTQCWQARKIGKILKQTSAQLCVTSQAVPSVMRRKYQKAKRKPAITKCNTSVNPAMSLSCKTQLSYPEPIITRVEQNKVKCLPQDELPGSSSNPACKNIETEEMFPSSTAIRFIHITSNFARIPMNMNENQSSTKTTSTAVLSTETISLDDSFSKPKMVIPNSKIFSDSAKLKTINKLTVLKEDCSLHPRELQDQTMSRTCATLAKDSPKSQFTFPVLPVIPVCFRSLTENDSRNITQSKTRTFVTSLLHQDSFFSLGLKLCKSQSEGNSGATISRLVKNESSTIHNRTEDTFHCYEITPSYRKRMLECIQNNLPSSYFRIPIKKKRMCSRMSATVGSKWVKNKNKENIRTLVENTQVFGRCCLSVSRVFNDEKTNYKSASFPSVLTAGLLCQIRPPVSQLNSMENSSQIYCASASFFMSTECQICGDKFSVTNCQQLQTATTHVMGEKVAYGSLLLWWLQNLKQQQLITSLSKKTKNTLCATTISTKPFKQIKFGMNDKEILNFHQTARCGRQKKKRKNKNKKASMTIFSALGFSTEPQTDLFHSLTLAPICRHGKLKKSERASLFISDPSLRKTWYGYGLHHGSGYGNKMDSDVFIFRSPPVKLSQQAGFDDYKFKSFPAITDASVAFSPTFPGQTFVLVPRYTREEFEKALSLIRSNSAPVTDSLSPKSKFDLGTYLRNGFNAVWLWCKACS